MKGFTLAIRNAAEQYYNEMIAVNNCRYQITAQL
jgi:hypothetical protein